MDTLETKRKLAAARQAAEKARRYASLADSAPDTWDEITAVESRLDVLEKRAPMESSGELFIEKGPQGFRGGVRGVSGWQIVVVVVGLVTLGALVAIGRGWI